MFDIGVVVRKTTSAIGFSLSRQALKSWKALLIPVRMLARSAQSFFPLFSWHNPMSFHSS